MEGMHSLAMEALVPLVTLQPKVISVVDNLTKEKRDQEALR
jgi:hypothetical protein